MAIVTALNQKGGVGKTSTCYHLAGVLAAQGRRVLLVDADPQSSLTQGFLGPQAALGLDPSATIDAILAGDAPFPEQVVRTAGVPGLDLVPGSREAARHNVPLPHLADWHTQVALRDFLVPIAAGYDLVLIDVPPNLHLCSWAALTASDAVVVPLQPEDFGAQGIGDVWQSVQRVQAGPNPALRHLGYVITMLSARRAVHQLYVTRLRDLYGDAVFTQVVPESTDFVEAIMQRKTVAAYKPKGAAAKAIKALGVELLARLAAPITVEEAA
jgi:chromosome partitioning protein